MRFGVGEGGTMGHQLGRSGCGLWRKIGQSNSHPEVKVEVEVEVGPGACLREVK